MHYRQESYADLKEILKDLEKERETLQNISEAGYGLTNDHKKAESILERMAEFDNHSIHTKIKRIEDEIKRRQGYTVP
jgi:hypothetical protein